MKADEFLNGLGDIYEPIPWDGCWIWKMGLSRKGGYGVVSFNKKSTRAHRLMYTLVKGEIPKGMQVLHHCDNKSCVNPLHLWLGTNIDNMLDRDMKQRQPRGTTHGNCLFAESEIHDIRRLISQGQTNIQIARKYAVGMTTIAHIKNGDTWGWLKEEAPGELLAAIERWR